MRAFFAFEIPEELRSRLNELRQVLRDELPGDAVRWVTPANLHITTVFLGIVPNERIASLTKHAGVIASRYQVTGLTCYGLGVFPNLRQPRVLWAGVSASQSITELILELAELARSYVDTVDANHRTLHLTLARARDPRDPRWKASIQAAIERQTDTNWGVIPITAVTLFQSELSPHGSRYTVVRRLPLKTAGEPRP